MTAASMPTRSTGHPDVPDMHIALGNRAPDGRTPADWPQIRPLVLAYLRAGRVVAQSTSRGTDEHDPDAEPCVPMGFRTDGAWIWALAVPYYVDKYGMCIDPSFLDEIRDRSFIPPDVTPTQVNAALAVLHEIGRALTRPGAAPSLTPDGSYR